MCVSLPNTITQVKEEEDLKKLIVKARMLIDRALEAASNYEGVIGMWIEVKWVLNKIRKKYWYPYLRIRYRNGHTASIYLGNKGGALGASLEILKYKKSKELIKLALQAEKYLRELEEAYKNLITAIETLQNILEDTNSS